MAKTKNKGKNAEFAVRRVKTKEDRRRPSVFMRLKTDEAFKGYALFEPDPEVENNPGFFEYYDHYDKQGNAYVPCSGDRCPFCAANDNPSTRALTVWYFPEAGDKKDQIKVFTMNYSTTTEAADEAEDEDGLLGKKVRIKRLSDKGDYRVKILSGKDNKPLTKAEIKKAMKLLEEKFGEDGLPTLVEKQLKAQMERLKALDALEDDDDDDDDDDEPKGKARKGKAVEADEDDDDDDDDDTDENSDDDDDSDDDDSDDDEDDDEDDENSDDDDSDDDDDESDDDDEEEDSDDDDDDDDSDEDEDEEESGISGVVYEVVKVQEHDEIFDLKNDDGKAKMWLGQGIDVDYDEIKKGVNVKVDAQTDDDGDWIITSIELVKKGKGGKKGKK